MRNETELYKIRRQVMDFFMLNVNVKLYVQILEIINTILGKKYSKLIDVKMINELPKIDCFIETLKNEDKYENILNILNDKYNGFNIENFRGTTGTFNLINKLLHLIDYAFIKYISHETTMYYIKSNNKNKNFV